MVSGAIIIIIFGLDNAYLEFVSDRCCLSHLFCRITPLLEEWHWLNVLESIQIHLCVIVYRCLHSTAPANWVAIYLFMIDIVLEVQKLSE